MKPNLQIKADSLSYYGLTKKSKILCAIVTNILRLCFLRVVLNTRFLWASQDSKGIVINKVQN